MLKFVSNYPISRRLFAAFALAAVLPSLIIALMGIYYVSQLNGRGTASTEVATAQSATNDMSGMIQDMYTQTKVVETQVLAALVNGKSPSASLNTSTDRAHSDLTVFANKWGNYQNLYDPLTGQAMKSVASTLGSADPTSTTATTESNLLHSIGTDTWPTYNKDQVAVLQNIQNVVDGISRKTINAPDAATTIMTDSADLDSAYINLNSNWQTLGTYVGNISDMVNGVNANQTQPIIMSTVLAFLVSMIVVIFSGFAVQRSITGPLTELVSLTRRISKGETTARARVNSRDEIAIVANSMNNMLDNIVHLIQDTQSQRDVLQGQVEKLVSEVSGVGEGDLRVQAEVTADALGVLADSFNYMVEELGSLVVRVKKVARDVEESTSLTSDRMNELVETADRQIQQIASAALKIESMAQTSQQVANRSQALASSAREARLSAQGGRQAVQQTVEGMGRIQSNVQETSGKVQTLGERSREINNIVEAISTIAHQTNRLALDAAIQAAMAGENGKGFGAVAADIRRLAERAKEQASSVGRIVRSVRDDIGAVAVSMRDTERETASGAKLAEEAGTSLEAIFSVIDRQAREIDIISQMATQQQQASSEVVQIMQVVSESTQVSSSSTREAAQNMERVARLAEQLLASVEAFKLRESLNYFAPNGRASAMTEEEPGGQFSFTGSFRTVTATAQPLSLPGFNQPNYAGLPVGGAEGFPQLSPAPYGQGNSNGQQYGQGNGNGQQFGFPSFEGNNQSAPPQWPSPNDWQSGNRNQSNW